MIEHVGLTVRSIPCLVNLRSTKGKLGSASHRGPVQLLSRDWGTAVPRTGEAVCGLRRRSPLCAMMDAM